MYILYLYVFSCPPVSCQSQVAKRKMEMLFVRGDSVILVSKCNPLICTQMLTWDSRFHRHREHRSWFLSLAEMSFPGLY